jgi:hypothetical protein
MPTSQSISFDDPPSYGAGWGIVAWIRDGSNLGALVPAWASVCRIPIVHPTKYSTERS